MFVNVAKVNKLRRGRRNSFVLRAFLLQCLMLMARFTLSEILVPLMAPLGRCHGSLDA
jgi:hypothetical protein